MPERLIPPPLLTIFLFFRGNGYIVHYIHYIPILCGGNSSSYFLGSIPSYIRGLQHVELLYINPEKTEFFPHF